ncbi:glycoside hydrolase family 47 protein [Conidiobolus coronatus NRRL 28638]|uniref:alpha-1,2-Mannosidase n=1 Tax=Conidiobolus coronatus (strain ATCC 28846 / CBS 209.66 / NRRL 28638) TaxID=796925 RepID=A0A137NT36_CONC2|nr:glycoside hydrolase family 47 protein [Conidiobolus coronatus NRRL 28638]|eukprot:KXN65923.1 glycoside hydrolase family 47 protein [Conidiobolus coronatus NRRL 28638]
MSFGTQSDSFYEYLIKIYFLTRKKDERLKRMYLESLKSLTLLKDCRSFSTVYGKGSSVWGFVLNTKESSDLGFKITETGYQFICLISPLIPESKTNYLGPELFESIIYSWRFTKNIIYRDQAWGIFKAFNKYSKTPSGFAEYENTQSTDIKENRLDSMESFWLAGTLKYLYLTYSD